MNWKGSKNGVRRPARTICCARARVQAKMTNFPKVLTGNSTGEQKQRLQSFFIGKINRLGDWPGVRAGGKTKDNAGILTAGGDRWLSWNVMEWEKVMKRAQLKLVTRRGSVEPSRSSCDTYKPGKNREAKVVDSTQDSKRERTQGKVLIDKNDQSLDPRKWEIPTRS